MHVSAQVHCSNAGFSYGPRTILHNINLVLAPGDRLGVVGPNGTGKTTLLRLLAGELAPEAGTVNATPPDARVGVLRQQLGDHSGETVAAFIRRSTGIGEVIAEFDAAVEQLATETTQANDRYDKALARYLATDAATIDERTVRALDSVGLTDIDLARLTQQLSGGQRTKLNLAAMLLASFDVLLFDEPTNDLDVDGLELIEQMILSEQRPIGIVSHDRAFLERTITSVFELDDHSHEGTRFNGGFAAWQEARELARKHHYEAFAEYNKKRSGLQERSQQQRQWSDVGVSRAKKDKSEGDKFIRAHRIATSEKLAGKAKQTERALERFERNEKVEAPWEPWELNLVFEAGDRSGSEVAVLQNATVAFDDFTLGPINLTLTAGDRVKITGSNGSGKTTLLKVLLGELEPSTGTRHLGRSVRPALLSQRRAMFAPDVPLFRSFVEAAGCDDEAARSQLAKLGLDTERITRPAGELSPGELTRAALGLFAMTGSNLLVLDEPTNHLDLPAIEQLESALELFPHTVLLVTHDRRLLEAMTTNRHWHLDGGQLTERTP